MKKFGLLGFGIACYLFFLATFIYFIGFLTDLVVPKSINDGFERPISHAIGINLMLIAGFGFFHSLLARERVKSVIYRWIPVAAERSLFVLQSSLFLSLAMWQWSPIPQPIWAFDGLFSIAMMVVFAFGAAMVLVATFLIDHFELFGLRQVWDCYRQRKFHAPEFRTPFLYRIVRHPMQLGMVLVLFAVPEMTVGHLIFAVSMTAYILIGLYFEERDLLRRFGEEYRNYQRHIPMLFPIRIEFVSPYPISSNS